MYRSAAQQAAQWQGAQKNDHLPQQGNQQAITITIQRSEGIGENQADTTAHECHAHDPHGRNTDCHGGFCQAEHRKKFSRN